MGSTWTYANARRIIDFAREGGRRVVRLRSKETRTESGEEIGALGAFGDGRSIEISDHSRASGISETRLIEAPGNQIFETIYIPMYALPDDGRSSGPGGKSLTDGRF